MSFKVQAADAEIYADVNACNWRWGHHVETRLYDGTGKLLQSRSASSGPDARNGVHVVVDAPGGPVEVGGYDPAPRAGQFCHTPGAVGGRFTGVLYLVVISLGDSARWTFSLTGTSGATLLGMEEGTSAFLHASRDFRGVANAQAWSGPGAGATVDGEVQVTVAGQLIGGFSAVGPVVLTVDAPGGARACPCRFGDGARPPSLTGGVLAGTEVDDLDGDASWGPGAYVFRATGASGGLAEFDVRLWGADVRFPQ